MEEGREAVGERKLHGIFLPCFPSWKDLGQSSKILGYTSIKTLWRWQK